MPDDTYKTVQGDTWDQIAYQVYGNEHLFHLLLQANPDHREVVFFSAGAVIRVPYVEPPTTRLPLPPWKRGGE